MWNIRRRAAVMGIIKSEYTALPYSISPINTPAQISRQLISGEIKIIIVLKISPYLILLPPFLCQKSNHKFLLWTNFWQKRWAECSFLFNRQIPLL
jgi:hypothetical protein